MQRLMVLNMPRQPLDYEAVGVYMPEVGVYMPDSHAQLYQSSATSYAVVVLTTNADQNLCECIMFFQIDAGVV